MLRVVEELHGEVLMPNDHVNMIAIYGCPPVEGERTGVQKPSYEPYPWGQYAPQTTYGTSVEAKTAQDILLAAKKRLEEVKKLLADHDALVAEETLLERMIEATEGPRPR